MTSKVALLVLLSSAIACRPPARPTDVPPARVIAHRIVPAPVSFTETGGEPFALDSTTAIIAGDSSVARTADWLAGLMRPSTGYALPVHAGPVTTRAIILRPVAGAPDESYELVVTRDSVRLTGSPAGIFRGAQTLRQMLPPSIESHLRRSGPWSLPAVTITDRPRFAWRGAMLDVARHFFTVHEVKQLLDLLALYKLNVLHLHLADDQGWRIEIASRPRLTSLGAVTQVGGGPSGFYTQADYSEIVRYAAERHITIVPEIDMPGHTNAALIGYPDLSCSRIAPAPYTGTEVGWSAFCPNKEGTYALIEDVVRELAAITPGPYLHVGGDEVEVLSHAEYARFIERVQEIVTKHGKQMAGWEEIAQARLRPTSLMQLWRADTAILRQRRGAKVIMSPSQRMYLDMKYDNRTELGLSWAAMIEVSHAYEWDPATYSASIPESDIVGVEAPLWSETVRNMTAAQYLLMPRLPAVAEVAWTPQPLRQWESFRVRLAAHAPRWNYLGVNYYRSPQIPW